MSLLQNTAVPLGLAILLPALASAQLGLEPDAEAEEFSRYNVEYIVFAYAEDVSVGSEVFPPDKAHDEPALPGAGSPDFVPEFGDGVTQPATGPQQPNAADSDALANAAASAEDKPSRMEAVLMLDAEFSLQRAYSQLERLDAYEPLLHAGWTQLALAPEDTESLELTFFGRAPAGLAGSFKLYRSRFLHLVVDLTLDGPAAPVDSGGFAEPAISYGDQRLRFETDSAYSAGAIRFRIEEDRIVKNGDVRYFDHPKFGVVVKVTRVEAIAAPETDEDVLLPPLGSDGE